MNPLLRRLLIATLSCVMAAAVSPVFAAGGPNGGPYGGPNGGPHGDSQARPGKPQAVHQAHRAERRGRAATQRAGAPDIRPPPVHATAAAPVRDVATGRIERSHAARRDFRKARPCPSTGRHTGACPGYQIDHALPLKCGGADAPSNMQWLTVQMHARKTAREASSCRRRPGPR